eukprot:jgi/Botrbrau1/20383/Bobra.0006s0044.1
MWVRACLSQGTQILGPLVACAILRSIVKTSKVPVCATKIYLLRDYLTLLAKGDTA